MDVVRLGPEDIRQLTAALEDRPTWSELWMRLRARTGIDSEPLDRLSLAFAYALIDAGQPARRDVGDGVFASVWTDSRASFPPRPQDVDAETWEVWLQAAEVVDDPIVVARIADLQFESAGDRRSAEHWKAAARARAALGKVARDDAVDPLERADAACRDLELATQVGKTEDVVAAAATCVALAEELTAALAPGPPLQLLRAVSSLKPALRPERLVDALQQADRRDYDDDARDAVLSMLARVAQGAVRADVQRERVSRARARAAAAEGFERPRALQRAAQLAEDAGLLDERDALLNELQTIDPQSLPFTTHRLISDFDRARISKFVAGTLGPEGTGLVKAIRRVGAMAPLSSSDSELDELLEARHADNPLLSMLGITQFGAGSGMPIFEPRTDEDRRRFERAGQRKLEAEWHGFLVANLLAEIARRHPEATIDQLAAAFRTDLIGPHRAQRLASGVELFLAGRAADSAAVLLPQIEAIFRELARVQGHSIQNLAPPGKLSLFKPLKWILDALRTTTSEDRLLPFLQALLVDPLSSNLRNDNAHGISYGADAQQAAALIWVACYLAGLGPATDAETSVPGEPQSDPPAHETSR